MHPTDFLSPLRQRLAPLIATKPVRFIALLGLCAAYLQGGVTKLFGFGAAVAETRGFGVPFPAAATGATIATELVGSLLVLTGIYRWLGAVWLAGFTLVASFLANRFWDAPPAQQFMLENAFFEHLGLAGGFLLVAWFDLHDDVARSN
ncbi:MAG TPA: DoxX family protein [Pseudomonadales bacterium]|nr:DoxX family protein [Pseudomonadales bacterium]